MPIGAALPGILSLGSTILGGILGNRKSARTTSSDFSQDSTSTTDANLSPRQRRLNKQAINALLELIHQGPVVSQSDKNMLRTSINDTIDSQRPRLESMLTARGFGGSGKMGAGFKGLELQRSKAFQSADEQLMHDAMDRWMQAIGMSKAFLTPYSTTTTNHSQGTGATLGPSTLGNTIAGAGNSLSSALWLQQLLGGGGGALNSSQVNGILGGLQGIGGFGGL